MNFLRIKNEKLKAPTRDTDQNPGAITHRDGETSVGGGDAPPPEQMETIAGAGGHGVSDDRTLQTTSGEGEDFYTKKLMKKPPADDVCPICFDQFHVPCRAPCGHWYCGRCILEYWNYSSTLLPCRCPMCLLRITKLTPEASLYHRREVEICKVLRDVGVYNRLFVGGIIRRFFAIQWWYLKGLFYDMLLNPDRPSPDFFQIRMHTMCFDPLYRYYPIEYLRIGQWKIPGPWSYMKVIDYIILALVIIVYFYKRYLRWRRDRNARALVVVRAE